MRSRTVLDRAAATARAYLALLSGAARALPRGRAVDVGPLAHEEAVVRPVAGVGSPLAALPSVLRAARGGQQAQEKPERKAPRVHIDSTESTTTIRSSSPPPITRAAAA